MVCYKTQILLLLLIISYCYDIADGVMGTLTENKKEREMKNKQNKSAYSCKFCFKKYLNKSILIKHEEMHGKH